MDVQTQGNLGFMPWLFISDHSKGMPIIAMATREGPNCGARKEAHTSVKKVTRLITMELVGRSWV